MAVLITGYRHEFTRGVLTALGSLIFVGIARIAPGPFLQLGPGARS